MHSQTDRAKETRSDNTGISQLIQNTLYRDSLILVELRSVQQLRSDKMLVSFLPTWLSPGCL